MDDYTEIHYTVQDPVAVVRLSRPAVLNALTLTTLAELRDALRRADRDKRVVGIVLTGEGRGFCAGLDMRFLREAAATPPAAAPQPTPLTETRSDARLGPNLKFEFDHFLNLRKPIIAAVNGPAAGLGFVLAMLCDVRIAGASATFNSTFAARGLVAEYGISWLLPRLIGTSRTLDVLWRATKLDAATALALGLVNSVVGDDVLVDQACGYVKDIAARSSPASLAAIKMQVYRNLTNTLTEAWHETLPLMRESTQHPDFREGVTAFVEARAPRFQRLGD